MTADIENYVTNINRVYPIFCKRSGGTFFIGDFTVRDLNIGSSKERFGPVPVLRTSLLVGFSVTSTQRFSI
jgi:hypothetical protein